MFDFAQQFGFVVWIPSTAYIVLGKCRTGFVFATEITAGQWNTRQHAKVLFLASRQHVGFALSREAIVDDLNRFRPDTFGAFGLVHIGIGAERNAQMAHLAGLDQSTQSLPKRAVVKIIIAGRVALIQVDIIRLQGAQRILQLPADVVGLPVPCASEVALKLVTELGGHDPGVAFAGNRLPHELLRQVVAITLGCIDQIDTLIACFADNRIDLRLRVVVPPFAAKLPGADAHDGHAQIGFSEYSVFHN